MGKDFQKYIGLEIKIWVHWPTSDKTTGTDKFTKGKSVVKEKMPKTGNFGTVGNGKEELDNIDIKMGTKENQKEMLEKK